MTYKWRCYSDDDVNCRFDVNDAFEADLFKDLDFEKLFEK